MDQDHFMVVAVDQDFYRSADATVDSTDSTDATAAAKELSGAAWLAAY